MNQQINPIESITVLVGNRKKLLVIIEAEAGPEIQIELSEDQSALVIKSIEDGCRGIVDALRAVIIPGANKNDNSQLEVFT